MSFQTRKTTWESTTLLYIWSICMHIWSTYHLFIYLLHNMYRNYIKPFYFLCFNLFNGIDEIWCLDTWISTCFILSIVFFSILWICQCSLICGHYSLSYFQFSCPIWTLQSLNYLVIYLTFSSENLALLRNVLLYYFVSLQHYVLWWHQLTFLPLLKLCQILWREAFWLFAEKNDS